MIKFIIYIRTGNLLFNRWMNTGEYSYNFENAVREAKQLGERMQRKTAIKIAK